MGTYCEGHIAYAVLMYLPNADEQGVTVRTKVVDPDNPVNCSICNNYAGFVVTYNVKSKVVEKPLPSTGTKKPY